MPTPLFSGGKVVTFFPPMYIETFRDIIQSKIAQFNKEFFYFNHDDFPVLKVRILKTKKRIRQIETSQTATGWE